MGRLIGGINGPVQGKIGKIIGSSWKGISYIKGPYKKRTGQISKLETGNREKFAAAHFWLRPLLKFVREGFKGYSPTVEGFIAAKSWLLRNAFEGVAPDFHINPSLVKVSFGNLPLSNDIAVAKTVDGQLQFTWSTDIIKGCNSQDQVMLLAYDLEHADAYFNTLGQFRSAGSDTLKVNTVTGRTYHVYFAFVADDRSRQSDSVYLGTITV